jgi:hypothetical protein
MPGMLVHFLHNGLVVCLEKIGKDRLDQLNHWADNHEAFCIAAMVLFGGAAIATGLRIAGVRVDPPPAATPTPT